MWNPFGTNTSCCNGPISKIAPKQYEMSNFSRSIHFTSANQHRKLIKLTSRFTGQSAVGA